MTCLRRDTIHVPLASNSPPYRIDHAAPGDCCIRVRRRGSDLLVLVPPGDGAPEFRHRLISELQAYSVRGIGKRPLGRLLSVLGSATYPVDPADALRDLPTESFRFLEAGELAGGPAMEALQRMVLHSPATLLPEERSVLWVLAARDGFYPSALSALRRLAVLRFEEAVRCRAREFAVEMQVVRDELESASGLAPPTSSW